MAQISVPISNRFFKLIQRLARPVVYKFSVDRAKPAAYSAVHEHSQSEPIFPVWPDNPDHVMKPNERMQADFARLRRMANNW